MYKKISVEQAKAVVEKYEIRDDLVIIDFRTVAEFATGHVEGALSLDYYADDLRERLEEFEKEKVYLIYCRSGYRSGLAGQMMQEMGFKRIYDFGVFSDWEV